MINQKNKKIVAIKSTYQVKLVIISLLALVLSLGFFKFANGITKGIGQTATVTVDCSDPDRNLLECNVTSPCTQNCHPASGSSGSCSCGFTCTTATTYDACGKATDANGLTDTKCTTGAVICNDSPVANAGSDKEIEAGESVILGGSGSDPNGDPLTFSWSCCETPNQCYCDVDKDGHYSTTPKTLCGLCASFGCQTTPGDDCDDHCPACYPGSTYYTASPDGKDQDCDGTVDDYTGTDKYYLFVQEGWYQGNLAGRAGADGLCVGSANKPSVCVDPAWAFISVSPLDSIRSFPITKGVRIDLPWYWKSATLEKRAGAYWGDLFDGSIENSAQSVGYTSNWAWTGSTSNGYGSGYDCSNWTKNVGEYVTGEGSIGSLGSTDGNWLGYGRVWCNDSDQIICACGGNKYY